MQTLIPIDRPLSRIQKHLLKFVNFKPYFNMQQELITHSKLQYVVEQKINIYIIT